MKLWQKDYEIEKVIEAFTVGEDRNLDIHLAPYDVLGSMAHIIMLEKIGLLEQTELEELLQELKKIYATIQAGNFKIEDGVEDVHSQVELQLTRTLGAIGKKIHSGRSRNDQVLVDLRLYFRAEMQNITTLVNTLFDTLLRLSETHKTKLLPGYTHTQVAMVSSFGLWFGAYAESLVDDMRLLQAVYQINNQNPLGSAAGFGSSFPLNRTLTTQLLGFEDLNYNVVHAQLGRGKTERFFAFALAALATTLGKFATDVCLYCSQNFGFIRFPDHLTTGSSIMPHKKNPDVFELIRAKCNQLQALPTEIALLTTNLISGYHRDFQLTKESLLPAIKKLKNCLSITDYMLQHIVCATDILTDEKYKYIFSVEEVNKLVLQGVPFRDAYQQIGVQIAEGSYAPDFDVQHTHEGSLGNLCTDHIQSKMEDIIRSFDFDKATFALERLLGIENEV